MLVSDENDAAGRKFEAEDKLAKISVERQKYSIFTRGLHKHVDIVGSSDEFADEGDIMPRRTKQGYRPLGNIFVRQKPHQSMVAGSGYIDSSSIASAANANTARSDRSLSAG
jgi:hypothetical protein